MLKATLTVFVFFIGIAFLSVGYITISRLWVVIDIGLGIGCILGSAAFAVIKVIKRLRS